MVYLIKVKLDLIQKNKINIILSQTDTFDLFGL